MGRIAAAVDRLSDVGFERVGERVSPWFGDTTTEMQRGAWRVTLGREKGQLFVTVSAGSEGGHDVGLWESCLDLVLPSLDPRDVEVEVDALIRRLPEMMRLDEDALARANECLRSHGLWRFVTRRELGKIGPPSTPD